MVSTPAGGLPLFPSRYAAPSARLPSLRSAPAPSAAQTFVIDRTGEMPAGALPAAASAQPQRASPALSSPAAPSRSPVPAGVGAAYGNGGGRTPPRFPAYDDADADAPRPGGTPEPIKVTRAKKKGAGSGKEKKKRTARVAEA